MSAMIGDIALLLVGVGFGAAIAWRGVVMLRNPFRWAERYYDSLPSGWHAEEAGGPPRVLSGWMWRVTGVLFILAGSVLGIVFTLGALDRLFSSATDSIVRFEPESESSWIAGLLGFLGAGLGMLTLLKPEILVRVQMSFLPHGWKLGDERMSFLRRQFRIVGAGILLFSIYAITVWLRSLDS